MGVRLVAVSPHLKVALIVGNAAEKEVPASSFRKRTKPRVFERSRLTSFWWEGKSECFNIVLPKGSHSLQDMEKRWKGAACDANTSPGPTGLHWKSVGKDADRCRSMRCVVNRSHVCKQTPDIEGMLRYAALVHKNLFSCRMRCMLSVGTTRCLHRPITTYSD